MHVQHRQPKPVSQIILFEKAYARVQTSLAIRLPDHDVILWHADDTLSNRGTPVDVAQIAPTAAWLSGDVLDGPLLEKFAAVLTRLPSLEWVQTANAGLDHPVYQRLEQAGVSISKSGAQSIAIAEYVLGYALWHAQQISQRQVQQADRLWQAKHFGELWQSRWLIVGYGHIGRNVATRAKAFCCDTTIVRRSGVGDEYADRVIPLDDIAAHLPQADVVVLACPASAATESLVDEAFLAALKPDTLLINVARGSLIDEQALLRSLDHGRPGHAVLDVFRTEPLPSEHPFWRHPSVTVTAHTSNAGSGTRGRGDELFLSNLERFAAGEAPLDIAPAG